jgi:hypothetical protein
MLQNVAAHFSPEGSLTINHGTPATGRTAITEAAQSFMTSFPSLGDHGQHSYQG